MKTLWLMFKKLVALVLSLMFFPLAAALFIFAMIFSFVQMLVEGLVFGSSFSSGALLALGEWLITYATNRRKLIEQAPQDEIDCWPDTTTDIIN